MANIKNNSATNIELVDSINIVKGTYASRRIALPLFEIVITANSDVESTNLHRRINFRRNIPMNDVVSIVRSFFKRGSYSGYPIASVSLTIGYSNECLISNPDILDIDLESRILDL